MQAEKWNRAHPIGSACWFRDGAGFFREAVTTSAAYVDESRTAVIELEGHYAPVYIGRVRYRAVKKPPPRERFRRRIPPNWLAGAERQIVRLTRAAMAERNSLEVHTNGLARCVVRHLMHGEPPCLWCGMFYAKDWTWIAGEDGTPVNVGG